MPEAITHRVWTIEKLEEIWPLSGYSWGIDELDGSPYLVEISSMVIVGVDDLGLIRSTAGNTIPVDIAAALAGAHQGRDSPEWMAAWLDKRASAAVSGQRDQAAVYLVGCAEMLRRGTAPTSAMDTDGITAVRTETLRLLIEAAEVGASHIEGGDYPGPVDLPWVARVRAAIESTRVVAPEMTLPMKPETLHDDGEPHDYWERVLEEEERHGKRK